MFQTTIFVVFNLILAAICFISFFKNFLIQYRMSDNESLTLSVILLIIAGIFCSISSSVYAISSENISNCLNSSPDITNIEIEQLKQLTQKRLIYAVAFTVIGYIFYTIHLVLLKKIQKIIEKTVLYNANKRWGFNK